MSNDGPTMPATVAAIRDSIRAMRDAAEARGEDWTGWYDAHEGADAPACTTCQDAGDCPDCSPDRDPERFGNWPAPKPPGWCDCGDPWCGDPTHKEIHP